MLNAECKQYGNGWGFKKLQTLSTRCVYFFGG